MSDEKTIIRKVPQMKFALKGVQGIHKDKIYPIGNGLLNVGREEDNDITVNEGFVSRYHAQLAMSGSTLTVTDNNSSNGTSVNDRPIHSATSLQYGDVIKFDVVEFVVVNPVTNNNEGLSAKSKTQVRMPTINELDINISQSSQASSNKDTSQDDKKTIFAEVTELLQDDDQKTILAEVAELFKNDDQQSVRPESRTSLSDNQKTVFEEQSTPPCNDARDDDATVIAKAKPTPNDNQKTVVAAKPVLKPALNPTLQSYGSVRDGGKHDDDTTVTDKAKSALNDKQKTDLTARPASQPHNKARVDNAHDDDATVISSAKPSSNDEQKTDLTARSASQLHNKAHVDNVHDDDATVISSAKPSSNDEQKTVITELPTSLQLDGNAHDDRLMTVDAKLGSSDSEKTIIAKPPISQSVDDEITVLAKPKSTPNDSQKTVVTPPPQSVDPHNTKSMEQAQTAEQETVFIIPEHSPVDAGLTTFTSVESLQESDHDIKEHGVEETTGADIPLSEQGTIFVNVDPLQQSESKAPLYDNEQPSNNTLEPEHTTVAMGLDIVSEIKKSAQLDQNVVELFGLTEPVVNRTFKLSAKLQTIGRSPFNDIILKSSSVSSQHAEIEKVDERWVVRDLGSSNGTYVNGELIDESDIYHDDSLIFGEVELTFDPKGLVPAPTSTKTQNYNISNLALSSKYWVVIGVLLVIFGVAAVMLF